MTHHFWTGLLGAITLVWVIQGIRVFRGMAKVPRLAGALSLPDAECPTVSILVPARDEEVTLPYALPTLLAQDYPQYEVIVVDDRSSDATPQILDEIAQKHKNLKVVHLAELPKGWLGKAHALSVAYQHARGIWLVFTDADTSFAPDLLRRALALVRKEGWGYLTSPPQLEFAGFWEKTAFSFSALSAALWLEAWPVGDPRSRRYSGFGSFQLLLRSAYESIGTHRRLAMEVVDDLKLGKIVKQGGFRCGFALSEGKLRLCFQIGFGNFVRNHIKNAFAACGFRLTTLAIDLLRLVAFHLLPFAILVFAVGAPRTLSAASVIIVLALHFRAARRSGMSSLFGFTHPLGAAIFFYILLRSTIATLWHGGVCWRRTFYPLEELRKGLV